MFCAVEHQRRVVNKSKSGQASYAPVEYLVVSVLARGERAKLGSMEAKKQRSMNLIKCGWASITFPSVSLFADMAQACRSGAMRTALTRLARGPELSGQKSSGAAFEELPP